ncbi:lytic transglycosylase domain-containing protein [Kitasatospora sp. NRRL B-11411]|uniref:lytic transglycosylase domain-containing protein n=1 Tax=Kitasatospora sp. NRRL B-11411 TaxID=1463822 RepID=UPI001E322C13|nr:lytic transglycosylase domain-containing protein [Kitasatospora sp. NRRL B-11411]
MTGIATLAVAGTATLALAVPQNAGSADAAGDPVLAGSPQLSSDAFGPSPSASASDSASAQAAAEASASAEAAAAASASASTQAAAEASASASASAQAEAEASASAAASASASAEAAAKAKASAEAKARASASASAASRAQQRPSLSASPSPSAGGSGSGSGSSSAYSGTPQQIAAQIVPAGQLQCFSNIVERESSWNVHATNSSSGAYGLMQALPGSKMASAGADWRDNPATQIKWGLAYMNETYGSPCAAWSFWQAHNWY